MNFKFSDDEMEANYQDELGRADNNLRQMFLRGYQQALRDLRDGKTVDDLQLGKHQEAVR